VDVLSYLTMKWILFSIFGHAILLWSTGDLKFRTVYLCPYSRQSDSTWHCCTDNISPIRTHCLDIDLKRRPWPDCDVQQAYFVPVLLPIEHYDAYNLSTSVLHFSHDITESFAPCSYSLLRVCDSGWQILRLLCRAQSIASYIYGIHSSSESKLPS
jgi:hypothetical protein